MTETERRDALYVRLAQVRTELKELGFEVTIFWRAPGQAKAPVAYLLAGESFDDIEHARKGLAV